MWRLNTLEFCVQIASMKKRSKYRKKVVLINPVAYVLESIKPVRYHDDYLINLKIKNDDSMASLTRGVATRKDIETLINMVDASEALYRMGFGEGYGDVVSEGINALREIGRRGAQDNRFIVKAQEMTALNAAMELHDAQMDIITVKDMERAIEMVNREFDQGKMKTIVERKET